MEYLSFSYGTLVLSEIHYTLFYKLLNDLVFGVGILWSIFCTFIWQTQTGFAMTEGWSCDFAKQQELSCGTHTHPVSHVGARISGAIQWRTSVVVLRCCELFIWVIRVYFKVYNPQRGGPRSCSLVGRSLRQRDGGKSKGWEAQPSSLRCRSTMIFIEFSHPSALRGLSFVGALLPQLGLCKIMCRAWMKTDSKMSVETLFQAAASENRCGYMQIEICPFFFFSRTKIWTKWGHHAFGDDVH